MTPYKRFLACQVKPRKLECTLDKTTYESFAVQPCFYCGGPMTGLDRLDPAKGYSLTNCVPACRRCNARKSVYEPLGWQFAAKKAKELAFRNEIPPPSKRPWGHPRYEKDSL